MNKGSYTSNFGVLQGKPRGKIQIVDTILL